MIFVNINMTKIVNHCRIQTVHMFFSFQVFIFFCAWVIIVRAHVSWTSIYVDGQSGIDLWTHTAKGCQCPWDTNSLACACCVKNSSCHCGEMAPNRCMQCGLEEHCNNMCNMTIDSTTLLKQSGKTFGQIKSPSLEGPGLCWYLFLPNSSQRIELQIYRMISIGKFNGTSCEGGHLRIVPDRDTLSDTMNFELCGANERYSPPAVIFSDHKEATLLFQIQENTFQSRFLAYFSFTSINNTHGLGYQPKGGKKLQNTDCDWLYQDFSCLKTECILASPGHPGVYPPNRQCNYHITTSSIHTHVHIKFTSISLPYDHCKTHYIRIYRGSTTSSPHLETLCDNRNIDFEYTGPSLLIEFRSGVSVPPFDYNGFVATLEFSEKSFSTEMSVTSEDMYTTNRSSEKVVTQQTSTSGPGCDIIISGNISRSGHFDTRSYEWHPNCQLVFKGRPTDVVHISLFNYRLRSPACHTIVEIIDGVPSRQKKPVHKICSPKTKHSRDYNGSFLEHQTFISTDNVLTLFLRRPTAQFLSKDSEYVDGAFLFHDEQISGTLNPNTMCDVIYYGMSSSSTGITGNPGYQHLFWNKEGPLTCTQQFIPAVNQSISITIHNISHLSSQFECQTQCGDGGCVCVPLSRPLSQIDHLMLISDNGHSVTCLCGDFQSEWMPITVHSWGPMNIVYFVAHYTWNTKGYEFSSTYNFLNDNICGMHTITVHSGEILSKDFTSTTELNYFYYQQCIWILDSNVERQVIIELSSTQNRPCSAWNISLHEYSSNIEDKKHIGELLHTFCPRERHQTYSLPWKLNTVVVRLQLLSRTLPQFKIKWRSQVVHANAKLGNITPAPNAISGNLRCKNISVSQEILIFSVFIYFSCSFAYH